MPTFFQNIQLQGIAKEQQNSFPVEFTVLPGRQLAVSHRLWCLWGLPVFYGFSSSVFWFWSSFTLVVLQGCHYAPSPLPQTEVSWDPEWLIQVHHPQNSARFRDRCVTQRLGALTWEGRLGGLADDVLGATVSSCAWCPWPDFPGCV